jgi:hypothetical protein
MSRKRNDTVAANERAANAAMSKNRDLSELREAIMSIIQDATVPEEALNTRGFIRREWEKQNPNTRMDDLVKFSTGAERVRVPDAIKISDWIDDLISYILKTTRDPETRQRALIKLDRWRMRNEVQQEVKELAQSDNATAMAAFIQGIDEEVKIKVTTAVSIMKTVEELMTGRTQIANQAREQFGLSLPPPDVREIVDRRFPDDGLLAVQLRQLQLEDAGDTEGQSA